MGNYILRKHIRNIISELFGGAAVYAHGPNKFPYLDGTDATTPSDLSAEFESELAPLPNEIEEFSEADEKGNSIDKKAINKNKH